MKPKVDDEGTTSPERPAAQPLRGCTRTPRSPGRSIGPRPCAPPPGSLRVSISFLLVFLLALASASPAFAAENLNLEPDPPILLGLMIGFALLIFPVNQLIFKPIFRALDERKARIDGARHRAKQIERDADQVLSDYEARIREARADADVMRKDQIAAARVEHAALTEAARDEAEQQIDEARNTLASQLTSAREGLGARADELARAAAEQILGRSLS